MPHGHCYLWRPEILWLHVVSDSIIFLSYMIIPAFIIFLMSRRPSIPYKWILLMFSLFILFCGFTHLVSILTIWRPYYAFEGLLKAVTAAISIATALLVLPLAPKAFSYLIETKDGDS